MFDVYTNADTGRISELDASGRAHTKAGIGIGSTLKDVKAAYGSGLVGPPESVNTPMRAVKSGDAWIGFLFDDPDYYDHYPQIPDTAKVVQFGVTQGLEPELGIGEDC